jgi:NAD(P)-dependent dehydrogenase (short-subunit alcohol dehydrogenase family)
MAKTVVITGANRGLGLCLAGVYAGQGFDVIGGCRRPDEATKLASLGATVLPLDMADMDSVAAFSKTVGRPVDVLFNCAGIDARNVGAEDGARGPLVVTADQVDAVFRVNVTGPIMLVQGLAESLRSAKGTVVNISSQVGSMDVGQRVGRDVAYNASKAALNMVTIKQAAAFADDGVTVISMHPGWLRTEMGGSSADLDPTEAAATILSTVSALTPSQSGQFLRWDGTVHPW